MNSIVSEKKFIQEKLGIPYPNLSQSYLRAETPVSNLNTYSFFLQRGQVQTPIVTERLLNLNDQFVITHFFIGLKYVAADTDSAHLNSIVQTYASAGQGLATAAGVYNANLSFTIDRKQYLPEFPMRAFYRAPQTQEAAVANAVDGFENGLYGFYPSEPTLIDGRQTLDINVEMGSAESLVPETGTIYLVAEFRGYLVVNAKS
jgi:hypothetical protein